MRRARSPTSSACSSPASSSPPTCCPPTSPARRCMTSGPGTSCSGRGRCSPTCCSPTRSTGPRPRRRRRCWKPMAEQQVTGRPVPAAAAAFIVLATDNPIENEGNYPLAEAQLDRFLLRTRLGYLPPEGEAAMLRQRLEQAGRATPLRAVVDVQGLLELRESRHQVHVGDDGLGYVVRLLTATREHPKVSVGREPARRYRGHRPARGHAAADGRDQVTPETSRRSPCPRSRTGSCCARSCGCGTSPARTLSPTCWPRSPRRRPGRTPRRSPRRTAAPAPAGPPTAGPAHGDQRAAESAQDDRPAAGLSLSWAPTAHYRRLASVALVPLLAAVVLGRPGYLVLAAPEGGGAGARGPPPRLRRPGLACGCPPTAASRVSRSSSPVNADPDGPADSAGVRLSLPPALAVSGGPAAVAPAAVVRQRWDKRASRSGLARCRVAAARSRRSGG